MGTKRRARHALGGSDVLLREGEQTRRNTSDLSSPKDALDHRLVTPGQFHRAE